MKKLMIAAAAVAMIGGAQAVTCFQVEDQCGDTFTVAATAHKVTISLKTTENKGKTSHVACEDDACTYWRQQASKKINGLIWEYLGEDACGGCVPFGTHSAFWTKEGAIAVDEFAIGVGMIGNAKSKKIEAYGGIEGEFGSLAWAGFGSMAASTKEVECEDDECTMYVKSISGGIAGQLLPAAWDDTCSECDVIEYAGCCDDVQLVNTAAYGTIKISYDKSTAKKIAAVGDEANDSIAAFYKLPAAAIADIDDVIAEVTIEE